MIEINAARRLGDFALDIECKIEGHGITALFGRSGAGKTSLVNLLAGLLSPEHGRIAIDSTVLFDSTTGIDVAPERRRLGYVFQESRLFPHLTVRGNLEYGMKRVPQAERRVAFDEVIDMLGIGDHLERRPQGLSGGERQRVSIGRALLSSPRLLLMDEPLASLDTSRKAEILPFIERLNDSFQIPIVYVTHAMDEIVRLADTLVLMTKGRVAAVGGVEELTSRLDLRPLTGRYEAGSVIRAWVVGEDAVFGLSELEFPGGRLLVPHVGLPNGTPVRLRIRARDVSVAMTPPRNTSLQNVLPGTVTEISETVGRERTGGGAAEVDIRLDIGVPLWARISRKAMHDLAIEVGSEVFALVKGTSVNRQSLMRARDRTAGYTQV